jgi:hypothetical protein
MKRVSNFQRHVDAALPAFVPSHSRTFFILPEVTWALPKERFLFLGRTSERKRARFGDLPA